MEMNPSILHNQKMILRTLDRRSHIKCNLADVGPSRRDHHRRVVAVAATTDGGVTKFNWIYRSVFSFPFPARPGNWSLASRYR